MPAVVLDIHNISIDVKNIDIFQIQYCTLQYWHLWQSRYEIFVHVLGGGRGGGGQRALNVYFSYVMV